MYEFELEGEETITQTGMIIIDHVLGKGDLPEKGKEVVISRVGNCLACHKISAINEPFQGNIGPNLDGVGTKYTQGELRLRLVDPYYLNPESLMPAFFQNENIYRVAKKYSGKTILTAQQIEDVISWLLTLK